MAARRRLTLKRLDPWSVLKFGFLANLCLLAIGLLAAVVVWFFINRLGLIEQACSIAESLDFRNCGVDGGNLFRALVLLGLLGVIIQTGVLVFISFLHNLIADLVGGLEVSVVDEGATAAAETAKEERTTRSRPPPLGTEQTRAEPSPGSSSGGGAGESQPGQPRRTAPPAPSSRQPAGSRGGTGPREPASPSSSESSSRQSMWSDDDGEGMFSGRDEQPSPIRQAGRATGDGEDTASGERDGAG